MNSTGACFAPALTDLWRNWWTATSGRSAWSALASLSTQPSSFGSKGFCALRKNNFSIGREAR